MDALISQVRIALRRTYIASSTIEKVSRGIRNQWIEKITICGEDTSGLIWCQLALRIDWARHQLHMTAGRTTITYDERWTDGTSIELDEALSLYDRYIRSKGSALTSRVYVYYISGITPTQRADIQRALGFVTAQPRKWAGEQSGTTMMIPELDEITVDFGMVI
ncbi:hypothetical protein [Thermoactinospora rubra]|uniref:hypothetical protein n=1 Tax=Thermoactinospora rubra TaxID=1088767 RepID=UPI000A10548A|nr:hypothetical protein [Thermoactinospora rubra]